MHVLYDEHIFHFKIKSHFDVFVGLSAKNVTSQNV